MNEKNYINFHVLISHSPSCLNRDDMNMQKSTVFGGVRRVRISSQSLKRAMRKSDYYLSEIGHPSMRTRHIVDMLVSELKGEHPQEAHSIIERNGLFMAALMEGKTKPVEIKKYKRADNGRIETQILPFNKTEISQLKELLGNLMTTQDDTEALSTLKIELKEVEQSAKSNIEVDMAFSGRMATSDIMYPVDGALAVAHVITTHAVDGDIDWFTAVDDLIQDEGETGSAHLDTQEFSSGVFYRYASLNIRQLMNNLGTTDRNEALKIAAHALHMLATVVPTAKQNSFAAHNLADLAMVSFSDQPISLANAFEEPVRSNKNGGGFLSPSIAAFGDYKKRVYDGYGLADKTAFFCLRDNCGIEADQKPTLEDLKSWVANNCEA
ncbi:MAG: type I-E CRISPR-associated protein Cas7/Cse4/CasC [Proteobacteria bacterium]|nr:type I-E CRISPR-associated protein Cas7/Cse4/CasC [Pseudomonadota bacterium]MBU1688290.1 type I-E CRISPR-associated protein Cas7/Cse4/CasC [Pseudomonadota bacterium]